MPKGKGDDSSKRTKRDRLKDEIDVLHREMEIANHGKTAAGQNRRKMSRKEMEIRTKKRRLLEQDDSIQRAIETGPQNDRIRGSRIALEDETVRQSRVFRDDEDYDDGNDGNEEDDMEDVVEGEIEADEEEDAVVEEIEPGAEESPPKAKTTSKTTKCNGSKSKRPPPKSLSKKQRKIMYRMKSFRSQRMAQKHGDALGAHAQGQNKEAVARLKEVAVDAPDAPQVYSSLGMVHEDQLVALRKAGGELSNRAEANPAAVSEARIEMFNEQIEMGTKAYGAYHISAVLCKKDFTLWVRAADMALQIAEIHDDILIEKGASVRNSKHLDDIRKRKRKWIEDAKRDFIVADKLKPPGIDVPAKLASVQIQLGELSDALTILTGLKNQQPIGETDNVVLRNDFEKSYKAWMLYSDLMLRIGFECRQWTARTSTVSNYMFRRWLRKYSTTFDWQERRLQSLVLALESASGSQNCSQLLHWIRSRARRQHTGRDSGDGMGGENEANTSKAPSSSWDMDNYEDLTNEPDDDVFDDDDQAHISPNREFTEDDVDDQNTSDLPITPDINQVLSLPNVPVDIQWQRDNLIACKREELMAFDRQTEELNISPGQALDARMQLREDLLVSHRQAIVSFVGETIVPMERRKEDMEEFEGAGRVKETLPLVASCRTVFAIAEELMKHCLGMELFTCGRLVGEAVSNYLKQRYDRRERKVKSNQEFTMKQNSTDSNVLLKFESYDEILDDDEIASDDDDDDDQPYLSDDDDIIEERYQSFVDTLKAGVLPPELQVLYGLCLIGEGGKVVFVAAKCLTAQNVLADDGTFEEEHVDTSVVQSKAWRVFHRIMTEPLRKTSALALIADLIKKVDQEREWARQLAGPFLSHAKSLLVTKPALLSLSDSSFTSRGKILKSQFLKIVVTAGRLGFLEIENDCETAWTSDCDTRAQLLFQFLIPILKSQWRPDEKGKLRKTCVEILRVLFQILSLVHNGQERHKSESTLKKGVELVSRVLDVVAPIQNAKEEEKPKLDLSKMQIDSDWQSVRDESLSILTFNLIVSCNVKNFSGWCEEPFHFKHIDEQRGQLAYVGVVLFNGRITGRLDLDTELKLRDLWKKVEEVCTSEGLSFDFNVEMNSTKANAEWYKTEDIPPDSISSFGERDALAMLLLTASSCIDLYKVMEKSDEREVHLRRALSILLPLTQFALKKSMWNSPIGKLEASDPRYKSRIKTIREKPTKPDKPNAYSEKESRRQRRQKGSERKSTSKTRQATHKLIDGQDPGDMDMVSRAQKTKEEQLAKLRSTWLDARSNRDITSRVVKIPNYVLQSMWRGSSPNGNESKLSTPSSETKSAMKKVEISLRNFRRCVTETSAQRNAVMLSKALLDLAQQEDCENPFGVVQLAAMVASQSASRGRAHEAQFKAPLPDESKCTPRQALVVLARSDCFQAIGLALEAVFLCNFAVKICRRNRALKDSWNHQWKVVAIHAYNTHLLIRSACNLTMSAEKEKKALTLWSLDSVDELNNCKGDALRCLRDHGIAIEVQREVNQLVEETVAELEVSPETADVATATEDVDVAIQKHY